MRSIILAGLLLVGACDARERSDVQAAADFIRARTAAQVNSTSSNATGAITRQFQLSNLDFDGEWSWNEVSTDVIATRGFAQSEVRHELYEVDPTSLLRPATVVEQRGHFYVRIECAVPECIAVTGTRTYRNSQPDSVSNTPEEQMVAQLNDRGPRENNRTVSENFWNVNNREDGERIVAALNDLLAAAGAREASY